MVIGLFIFSTSSIGPILEIYVSRETAIFCKFSNLLLKDLHVVFFIIIFNLICNYVSFLILNHVCFCPFSPFGLRIKIKWVESLFHSSFQKNYSEVYFSFDIFVVVSMSLISVFIFLDSLLLIPFFYFLN